MGIKVGFFTEGGFEGKITLDNPNIRTDAAWMYLTDATHHPFSRLSFLPDNLYDVGVMILPKKRRMLLNYPLLEQYRRVCKKVTVMQESYYNYWQDSPLDEQIWYFNFITEMDLIFCHNDVDLDYYYGLTNVRTELMPTAMVTEGIVRREGLGNGVIIGGNWVKDYGGFDSYQVSREITDDITAITTGRMKPEETQILKHIPWVMWRDWIDILGQYNVGVQLGTAAAGQFQLNTSFHGIPCIGYSNLNTQSILHPLTTVELGDIDKAKDLARKLKDDKFYKLCMDTTQKRFQKYYSEEMFLKNWKRIWS
tara:strand:- start:1545 stop:2471 length:927 start_codon:yes stop_codon:yes gene_type:complete